MGASCPISYSLHSQVFSLHIARNRDHALTDDELNQPNANAIVLEKLKNTFQDQQSSVTSEAGIFADQYEYV